MNLINSRVPFVKYRATTYGGEVFYRSFEVSRRETDLATHMQRAQRTFEADPWLVSLEVITGRRGRAMWARREGRVY